MSEFSITFDRVNGFKLNFVALFKTTSPRSLRNFHVFLTDMLQGGALAPELNERPSYFFLHMYTF